ncbi:hypothetical protein ALC60_14832, partial [Trachymyrmex zeteki]
FLRDMNDRVIFTRPDKGNMTVALDRQVNISKVNEMLQDENTYEVIEKDPTSRIVTGLRVLLVSWKEEKYRIYLIPHIEIYHKQDCPFRIIVSSINSPLYSLAVFLHSIIIKTIPKADSHIENYMVLLENGYYPLNFIFENINNRLKNIIIASNRKSIVNDNSVDVVQPSWFTVPFVRGITEKFDRLNNDHIRVSFYSINKLREFIRVRKDPLSRNKKSNIVYKISCKSSDTSYVEQTYRQLKSRIMEHRNHIRWNTSTRNVIKEHRLQEDHDFDWNNVTILDEEPHYRN